MGQQLGGETPGRCCQQNNESDALLVTSNCVNSASLTQAQDAGYNMIGDMGRDWHCLRAEDGPNLEVVGPSSDLMESLSYIPVRFDVGTTIDVERSQARYSNLVVHSSHARLQRRSKCWEDWLRAATAGRNVMLLSGGFPEQTPSQLKEGALETPRTACEKVPARYFLDRALTRISIMPVEQAGESLASRASLADTILVDSIQVICTATDFKLFADHVEFQLDDAERRRAVLIQYLTEVQPKQRRRACFLEATPQDKDRFVQAMTALWLEKRTAL